jgi:hypothetical protein
MDNNRVVHNVYAHLRQLGLEQNREKFSLPEAGHRGFAVDVGSVRGEVLIRVQDNGIQVDRFPILNESQIEDAIVAVGLLVQHKKAEIAKGADTAEQLGWEGADARDRSGA